MCIRDRHYSILFNSFPGTLTFILAVISGLFFIIGLAGYQANFIQLGLDQLCDAPSQYLGLFIHYMTWAFHFGAIPMIITLSLFVCASLKLRTMFYSSITLCIALSLIILLLISCWKYHWFHTDHGQTNPYKTVFKVVDFARKHKYPLQRSAFTYCDNYVPSRLDFAKERFGGPFTTCLLYTSPSPRDATLSRMPSSA